MFEFAVALEFNVTRVVSRLVHKRRGQSERPTSKDIGIRRDPIYQGIPWFILDGEN
jgi:hypothetical protein